MIAFTFHALLCNLLGKGVAVQIFNRIEEARMFFPFASTIEPFQKVSAKPPHNILIDTRLKLAYRILGRATEPNRVAVEIFKLRPYIYKKYDLSLIGS